MPVGRCYHTATALDGKIYVLGGMRIDPDNEDDEVATDRVDVYDPAADSWQQMAAMPAAKYGHSAAVLDGKIYASGGFTTLGEHSDALEAFDPVTNTWTTLASLSGARAFHASVAFNGKLCVFGGWASPGRIDLVEVYSLASNSWERSADMPSAIHSSTVVAL